MCGGLKSSLLRQLSTTWGRTGGVWVCVGLKSSLLRQLSTMWGQIEGLIHTLNSTEQTDSGLVVRELSQIQIVAVFIHVHGMLVQNPGDDLMLLHAMNTSMTVYVLHSIPYVNLYVCTWVL